MHEPPAACKAFLLDGFLLLSAFPFLLFPSASSLLSAVVLVFSYILCAYMGCCLCVSGVNTILARSARREILLLFPLLGRPDRFTLCFILSAYNGTKKDSPLRAALMRKWEHETNFFPLSPSPAEGGMRGGWFLSFSLYSLYLFLIGGAGGKGFSLSLFLSLSFSLPMVPY